MFVARAYHLWNEEAVRGMLESQQGTADGATSSGGKNKGKGKGKDDKDTACQHCCSQNARLPQLPVGIRIEPLGCTDIHKVGLVYGSSLRARPSPQLRRTCIV